MASVIKKSRPSTIKSNANGTRTPHYSAKLANDDFEIRSPVTRDSRAVHPRNDAHKP